MKATTQNGTRSAILPLSRQYRSDGMYNVKRLQGRFATDTFYLKSKSIYGNTYVQIYQHKNRFAACYLLTSVKGDQIGKLLSDFIHDFGAREHLTFDGVQVQVERKIKF